MADTGCVKLAMLLGMNLRTIVEDMEAGGLAGCRSAAFLEPPVRRALADMDRSTELLIAMEFAAMELQTRRR